MNERLRPLHLPGIVVYDDDASRPADCQIEPTRVRTLADMMRVLGLAEVAKNAPAVRLLGDFKPMALLSSLKTYAEQCNGRAALLCIDRPSVTSVCIWNKDAEESLHRLTKLKLQGGFVLGYIVIQESGIATCYPEGTGLDRDVSALLLNLWRRLCFPTRTEQADDEFSSIVTFNDWADWSKKYADILTERISFPDPNSDNGRQVQENSCSK